MHSAPWLCTVRECGLMSPTQPPTRSSLIPQFRVFSIFNFFSILLLLSKISNLLYNRKYVAVAHGCLAKANQVVEHIIHTEYTAFAHDRPK